MTFNPDLHMNIKHAEDCLIELVGEDKFLAWCDGLEEQHYAPSRWYNILHLAILGIRACAINDTSRREIVIISQYFPHLGINAR